MQLLGLVAWLAVSFVAAGIGGIASMDAGSFYVQLERPVWAPPQSVFGPMWTVLYVSMGIAAWLVWRSGGLRANSGALSLFLLQLALNALWTWLFFAWHRGAWAFFEILVLWAALLATIVTFWRVERFAAALLIPYLAWVSFAAALTYSIWSRNPEALGGWHALAGW